VGASAISELDCAHEPADANAIANAAAAIEMDFIVRLFPTGCFGRDR
jgi:hypothetical protein